MLLDNATRCDLCELESLPLLFQGETGYSLRSDKVQVPISLQKWQCPRCGLVQGANGLVPEQTYTDDYETATSDHVFYTPTGSISRSKVFCDWILRTAGRNLFEDARQCLEIGAGTGGLLELFLQHFSETEFQGLELSTKNVREARRRGLPVQQKRIQDLPAGSVDVVYAVAVLEHVDSPTQFLAELRRCLRPGGWLILCQPTQDVSSYDIFFLDHLYHFGSDHLRFYAQKCGFREAVCSIGHELMPNFSLHVWQRVQNTRSLFPWCFPVVSTNCRFTLRTLGTDFQRVDRQLKQWSQQKRRVAVMGLNEVFALFRTYSTLGEYPLCCGFDDRPDRLDSTGYPFPIVRPEEYELFGVDELLLTLNKQYYPQITARFAEMPFHLHPVLS